MDALRAAQSQPFFRALMEEMAQFGVPVEGLHTETGPGVFEAAIIYSEGIEAADRGATQDVERTDAGRGQDQPLAARLGRRQ